MLILSIYVLIVIFLESFVVTDEEIGKVLQYVDLGVCLFFLADFFANLWMAKSKKDYLKWGWIDFVSAIPTIDTLRWGRLSRVIRVFRFFRSVKSLKILLAYLQQNKIKSLTLAVVIVTFLAYTISCSLILEYERSMGGEINTAQKALWWGFLNIMNAKVSITQAVSNAGMVFTVILNKVGLVLFAYFNAIIIAWLVNKRMENKRIGS